MKDLAIIEEDLIDLGQASVETKGEAIFLTDDDGSPRVYLPGVVAD